MKLQNSLYDIISDNHVENAHEYEIKLNPEHIIYQAHFPGEPITPGVCILHIALELIEDALQAKLVMTHLKNVKFLQILSPKEVTKVKYTFQKIIKDEEGVNALVVVSAGDKVYSKMSFSCKEI